MLKHRHDLELWWGDDVGFMEMMKLLQDSEKDGDAKQSDFWLSRIMTCCDLKSVSVPGSADFESIKKIYQDQELVERIMGNLILL